MRIAIAALALAGCNLFPQLDPQHYPGTWLCSDNGTCPPGEVCNPSDNTCYPESADFGVVSDSAMADSAGPSPPDFMPPPDLVQHGMRPIGAACSSDFDCATSLCLTSIGNIKFPQGYCSSTCTVGCPAGSTCLPIVAGVNYCLETCTGPGECGVRNSNNACFAAGPSVGVCAPQQVAECITNFDSVYPPRLCPGNMDICYQVGFDPVGLCGPPCTYGGTCANDANTGFPTVCDFIPTGTADGGGLYCVEGAATVPANGACMSPSDCVPGYECDLTMTNQCKKLCRNGMTGDCPSGSCQNAFGLSNFGAGSIGLCR